MMKINHDIILLNLRNPEARGRNFRSVILDLNEANEALSQIRGVDALNDYMSQFVGFLTLVP